MTFKVTVVIPYNTRILTIFKVAFFIQAAGLVYHRRTKCGVYHQGRRAALVSHQPLWGWIPLRLDDIQPSGLMIYRNELRMIYTPLA